MKNVTRFRAGTKTLHSSLTNQGWMRTEQVATFLGISENNVRIMVARGQLPARKYLGRWYFKGPEIDLLIEKGEQ